MLSANQRWKQSGTSLSFKEWINREKAKGVVIPQKGVTDVYLTALNNQSDDNSNEERNEPKTVVGLSRNILLISGLVIIGAVAFNYFKYRK